MISLASLLDKSLRAQVAETVSIIAGYNFPERWEGLVKELMSTLDPAPDAYAIDLSVLETGVYLLTAVATLGATAQQGVTSTNALVDVVNILVIKRNFQLLFNQEDTREVAPQILNAVLSRVGSGHRPIHF
ncbi:CSE1 [Sanghuangporus sanghuang]